MKHSTPIRKVIIPSTILFLLSISGLVAATIDKSYMDNSYGPMGMMGMDTHMGQGHMMGEGMRFGMLSRLNLSTDQQKMVNKLHDDMRRQHWKIMGDIMDLQAKIRDALNVDKPEPKEIGDIYEKVSSLQRKMLESRVETRNKVRDLLTDDQRKQYDSIGSQYGWGGGQMMRHRWSYDMNE